MLLGVAIFQRELGMVSPWMEQGNLVKYLRGNPNVERYPLVCLVSLIAFNGFSFACSVFSWLPAYRTFTTLEL